jgi:hypothetical protein
MRALAVVLAVAATVSLSGCLWWADEFDDEGSEDGSADPEVAFILLGGAVIVGIVLVAINLSNPGGSQPPPPMLPPRPPQPPVQAGWQEVEVGEDETPIRPGRPAKPAAAPKTARRRAP